MKNSRILVGIIIMLYQIATEPQQGYCQCHNLGFLQNNTDSKRFDFADLQKIIALYPDTFEYSSASDTLFIINNFADEGFPNYSIIGSSKDISLNRRSASGTHTRKAVGNAGTQYSSICNLIKSWNLTELKRKYYNPQPESVVGGSYDDIFRIIIKEGRADRFDNVTLSQPDYWETIKHLFKRKNTETLNDSLQEIINDISALDYEQIKSDVNLLCAGNNYLDLCSFAKIFNLAMHDKTNDLKSVFDRLQTDDLFASKFADYSFALGNNRHHFLDRITSGIISNISSDLKDIDKESRRIVMIYNAIPEYIRELYEDISREDELFQLIKQAL